MLSERFGFGLKVVLGILPILYGGIMIAALPNTLQWAIVVVVVLVTLLVLVGWLDCSLETVWPVFPGAYLIMAGLLVLYVGAPALGPITSTFDELLMLFVLGAVYIFWGVRSTWKAARFY